MSLSVWKASAADCFEHQKDCDRPLCPTCLAIEEKAAWYEEIKNDERLAREAEQVAELDEFERAEIARDMECGDWDSDDLRTGDLPR